MAVHYDLSVIAIVGIILLIGIVKKNGIMLVHSPSRPSEDEGRRRSNQSTEPACCASGRS